MRIVGHSHTSRLERVHILVVREEADFVPFGEVLDAIDGTDEEMNIQYRQWAVPLTFVHPCDLQIVVIHEIRGDSPRPVRLRQVNG